MNEKDFGTVEQEEGFIEQATAYEPNRVIKPCCDYHDEGSEKINAFIMTASARAGKSLYDGKPWIYCPWCGEQIRTEDRLSALLTTTEVVENGYVSPIVGNDVSAGTGKIGNWL